MLFWNDLQQEIAKDKIILKKTLPLNISAIDGSVYGCGNRAIKKTMCFCCVHIGLRISEYIESCFFGEMGMLAG